MNEMKEAVGNWREAKQFSPADENDFLRWLDKADTEEKLFSRLTFWFTFRGLPADQNQRYHLVQERARELRLWNGLELKLRRWQDRVADEYEQIGKEAFAARIGEDYAGYINSLTDPEAAPQQAAPEPEIAKPAGVQAWSARELSEMELPPIRHVVEGLLPMGMGVLVAKPKLGKSWMVLDLCLAVAQGEPFLGFPTRQHGTLYLALEDGKSRMQTRLRRLLEGSRLSFALNPDKVQDAYAIRCTPQIHGASRDAIGYVWDAVSREINAVTDNPLIFPEEDEVISGGNFHGQPMALAMDFLGIAVAEFANVSERRLERLVNPALSEGLPAFLTKHGGVHSGFMIAQYAAASMVSESKVYAHPASVDSIPSSANQEDHVSMGTTAARKALMILDNSQKVLAIELFAGAQALWLRDEDKLSPATRAVYDRIRTVIPPIEEDVVMHPLMVRAEELVKEHALSQAAEAVCGELK